MKNKLKIQWFPTFFWSEATAWCTAIGTADPQHLALVARGFDDTYRFNRRLLGKKRMWLVHMGMGQNPIPLVNIKIAGKWMFIPLKMVCIGIDPYPYLSMFFTHKIWTSLHQQWSLKHKKRELADSKRDSHLINILDFSSNKREFPSNEWGLPQQGNPTGSLCPLPSSAFSDLDLQRSRSRSKGQSVDWSQQNLWFYKQTWGYSQQELRLCTNKLWRYCDNVFMWDSTWVTWLA